MTPGATRLFGVGHHATEQLVPEPAFVAFFHKPIAALTSTGGIVCLRDACSAAYYVTNPSAFTRDFSAHGDPAVVIAFNPDPHDADPEHADAIYIFESFSSRAWA